MTYHDVSTIDTPPPQGYLLPIFSSDLEDDDLEIDRWGQAGGAMDSLPDSYLGNQGANIFRQECGWNQVINHPWLGMVTIPPQKNGDDWGMVYGIVLTWF